MAEIRFWMLVSHHHHLPTRRWGSQIDQCSELLFHPIRKVFTKGPLTPIIREFMWSPIPIHSKYSILGYIFSYYAIAISWTLTCANYFLEGFNIPLDAYCECHSTQLSVKSSTG